MTSKAFAEFDPMRFGVRIAMRREGRGVHQYLTWQPAVVVEIAESSTELVDDLWLRLPDDDARALYEALADYFGHAGHDTRALRRDYDAERGRVDRLIGALVKGAGA